MRLGLLSNSSQCVRQGEHNSSTLILNTEAPKGYMLSALLYTLYTHDCSPSHLSNQIFKRAADATVVGLITNNKESAYRREVENLAAWCKEALNIKKTKEIITDFWKPGQHNHPLLYINSEKVERVSSFKFLGLTVMEKLSWGSHIALVIGKAQQRLFYLRKLKRAKIPQKLMVNFYHCAISSLLTCNFLVWFSSCIKAEQQAVQRIVETADRIIGTQLPGIYTVHPSRCLHRSHNIIKDRSHPAHHLFDLLPSGRRYGQNHQTGEQFLPHESCC